MSNLRSLETLNIDNTFTKELPGEVVSEEAALKFSRTPHQVQNACWSWAEPEAVTEPKLVAVSEEACKLIGLEPQEKDRPEFTEVFTGNKLLENSKPWAHCYGGHQFGVYAGQLGDGRAISLGEVVHNDMRWELQLKGAGLTPYSRFADGYAVLRSSIREFLCSEAMAALDIPTSRALSLVANSREVYRERVESGAVVCRLAPSWVRFGSFEIFHYRGQREHIKTLADYIIKQHFPSIRDGLGDVNKYGQFFEEVTKRTAKLIARWQTVGFCHGVMNTDNMSILGLTIDYGPFGFLDSFDPEWICNHSDDMGRYSYNNQPGVGLWNLSKLGRTMLDLIGGGRIYSSKDETGEMDESLKKGEQMVRSALEKYGDVFVEEYTALMRKKLGLLTDNPEDLDELINPLSTVMAKMKVDYTNFFRKLSNTRLFALETTSFLNEICPKDTKEEVRAEFADWCLKYHSRLTSESNLDDGQRSDRMKQSNPKYVLRNWIAQEAIDDAEKQDFQKVRDVLKILQNPFNDEIPGVSQDLLVKYASEVPEWGKGIQCSCSS
ncbi:UPF0061-domain-containing protein [Basidiobolus meristosporus CBS 931.73]|uniref:Selenoprotein O n=1 Tax=Basidiobolus meristosporus CBS 931.73 TaxID=1314790 RepID=A0A1Y1XUM1_9FUNG|nr:UPF0061-domain-containing protein [Basidiobolus meristosporus CBS 931.73]|eukprot:ORX89448.1 UPF0061-domain-containing protein [Basidiobolus meristosporus CBS 931.73]